jgi:hypothetical protein
VRKSLLIGTGAFATVASAQTAAGDGLLAGAWNETVSLRLIDASSSDPSTAETSTDTVCYTEEDAADVRRVLLAGAEEDCSVSHFSMIAGKVTMSLTCRFSGMDFDGDLTGTYGRTSFELRGVMRSRDDTIGVEAAMSARRVGICKA